MWTYNTATNTWAPLAVENKPAPRFYASSWLSSSSHGFYIFGGRYSFSADINNYYNDLWFFDFNTLQFSLITNGTIPTRGGAYSWSNGDDLWIFGGSGNSSLSGDRHNGTIQSDMWKYSTYSLYWTPILGTPGFQPAVTEGNQIHCKLLFSYSFSISLATASLWVCDLGGFTG